MSEKLFGGNLDSASFDDVLIVMNFLVMFEQLLYV